MLNGCLNMVSSPEIEKISIHEISLTALRPLHHSDLELEVSDGLQTFILGFL